MHSSGRRGIARLHRKATVGDGQGPPTFEISAEVTPQTYGETVVSTEIPYGNQRRGREESLHQKQIQHAP